MLMLSSLLTFAISKVNATDTDSTSTISNTTSELKQPEPKVPSEYETVYIITDESGEKASSFIGNTINTSDNPLPLAEHITYYLNGSEISAKDLKGKSGHVRIKYAFTSQESRQGKLIPFLTITSITLDNHKFKNLKLKNVEVISKSSDSTLLAGYTLAGLGQDLGTDFLPDSFSIEADVEDFELPNTYSIAENDIFSEIDTSKINKLDDLISAVNQLSSSFNQIVDGSSALTSGLDSALAGSISLQSGISDLNTGAQKLANGASDLNNGAKQLANGVDQLSSGLNSLVDFNNSILNRINSATALVKERINAIIERYDLDAELIAELEEPLIDYYNQAYTAVTTYTGNIEKLSNGANSLKDGAHKLASGTSELKNGTMELASGTTALKNGSSSLVDGLKKLSSGSHTLTSGLNTFKSAGIDKLTNFANQDLDTFLNNFRQTISASRSYHSYDNKDAISVKFIFKTKSIK